MRSSIGGSSPRLGQLGHERGFVEQLGGGQFLGDGEGYGGAEIFRGYGGPFGERLGDGCRHFGFGQAGRLLGEGVCDCLGYLAFGNSGLGCQRLGYGVGYLIFSYAGLGGESIGYRVGDLCLGDAGLGGQGLRYFIAHLLGRNAGLVRHRLLNGGGHVGGRHALRLSLHRLLDDLRNVDRRGRGRYFLRGGASHGKRG